MSQYDRGRRFEWKTRTHLRDEGYEVIRGAGSKVLDLVAVKPGQQLFVGCKLTGVCPASEWDRLVELASWVGAVPVLAVNGPKGHGVRFWQLAGRKQRGKPMALQPAVPFLTDEVAGLEVYSVARQEWVELA